MVPVSFYTQHLSSKQTAIILTVLLHCFPGFLHSVVQLLMCSSLSQLSYQGNTFFLSFSKQLIINPQTMYNTDKQIKQNMYDYLAKLLLLGVLRYTKKSSFYSDKFYLFSQTWASGQFLMFSPAR